ncbi:SH3 domain-containing protein [Bradyrhizobium sp.]|uniref:SH3 domain-containing protein n=1 Tax=Bradyrhizobium sp. TaxID=376 RepID=UPI001D4D3171|nr:SH3 domain-containing protein [Bradyrhizobium sp.]MBI5321477.1 SH3 domain-containing protein [Bradyrhizobium sp.]
MNKMALIARSLPLTALIGIAWIASGDPAGAQSRLFSCPHARVVELTVTGPNTVSANPIDGKPMTMKRDPGNPLRFFNGDYAVILTPDQGALRLEIPDWGSAKCLYGTQNVKPFIPGSTAAATSCGPGFHPVPETDRCDPDRGTPPTAQPRRTGTAEGKFPMAGQSLGGIMRSAPSMSSARVMSLSAGAAITLVERAGAMDGYDWFKVSYRGTTGYQWGGIMCSQAPIRGIFQQCEP